MTREEALELANERRYARAAVKRHWRTTGTRYAPLREFAALATEPPAWAYTWEVAKVMDALPFVGPVKIRSVLARGMVPGMRQLGELTHRQATYLAEWALSQVRDEAAA